VKIVSIGEILWDVFPDGERLGGACFNLAAHARKLGHDVFFVSAVGDDARGRRALAEMERLGLPADHVRTVQEAPTGVVTVRLSGGQPDYTIHRPAAYDLVETPANGLAPDWICYGTLMGMDPRAFQALRRLIEANPQARKFYDVNLRRNSWTSELVHELMDKADVIKLNEDEAAMVDVSARNAVCITRGERGCTLRIGDEIVHIPVEEVNVVDLVGAGDAWSAAFLHAYNAGWPLAQVGAFANRLGALVASRPGAIPEWSPAELGAVPQREA
jgi:fructokinase